MILYVLIIVSGQMPLVKQNLRTYTNRSIELLKDWVQDPMDLKEVRQAWEMSRPVRKQMLASGYVSRVTLSSQ